jgi:Tol biopolymer transport system component
MVIQRRSGIVVAAVTALAVSAATPAAHATAATTATAAGAPRIERVSVSSTGGQIERGAFVHAISADGRYVAFVSNATTLAPGNTLDRHRGFVHDRRADTTELVDISSAGTHADDSSSHPSISADGRFVAFGSGASNLAAGDTNDTPDAFIRDRWTGVTTRVSGPRTGPAEDSSLIATISGNGRAVAFASNDPNLVPRDTNNTYDMLVRNHA